jgi:CDP-glycerol glycerophosphotransferase
MKKLIIYCIEVFFYYLFRIFPIQKNKIFFQNYNGKGYGDNPKYIAEEILRCGYDFILVWAVRSKFKGNIPQKIKTVPYISIRAIYESVTAKIWIDNCRKQIYVRKRKGQYYIQTWHATINFKKVERDVENKLSKFYVKHAKYDSKLVDLFLSASKFTTQLYRSSFWYNGEIFECGTPREDILINQKPDINEKVKKHFNISKYTKIILYAPTFRNDFNTDIYDINYKLILDNLQEQTKENWVFLMRLHPNDSKKSGVFLYNDLILNASDYDDMQEILMTSDILITDYSDCSYEFALMNKPVFLYIKDYEQYKIERNFYFDIFSLPFPSARNNNELLQKILNFNTNLYLKSLNEFFLKVGILKEGNASQKIVKKIMDIINDNC